MCVCVCVCVCVNCYFMVWEEYSLKVFENRVLRKIFGRVQLKCDGTEVV